MQSLSQAQASIIALDAMNRSSTYQGFYAAEQAPSLAPGFITLPVRGEDERMRR